MRRLSCLLFGALLLMTLALPFVSDGGAAVKLGSASVIVETLGYNETHPLLDGSWLVWKDDNGTGQDYPAQYRLWARDLDGGGAEDTLIAANVSSRAVALEVPWVAFAGRGPTGGEMLLLYNLETHRLSVPDLGHGGLVPGSYRFSDGNLFSMYYNYTAGMSEFWSHHPSSGVNEQVFQVDGWIGEGAWYVDVPGFVFANFTAGNNTLWLYQEGGRGATFTRLHGGDSYYDVVLAGDRVVWSNSTALFIMNINERVPVKIFQWEGDTQQGYQYASSIFFDGAYVVWTFFSESYDGGRGYSSLSSAYLYSLAQRKVQGIVEEARAGSANQSYLYVDQDRFVWQEEHGDTHDLWWRTTEGGAAPAAPGWLAFSRPAEDGTTLEDESRVIVHTTPEGSRQLGQADRFRLLLTAPTLDEQTLWDSQQEGNPQGLVEYRDRPLFRLDRNHTQLSSDELILEGVLYSRELPNGQYTLRVEALDGAGKVLSGSERVILVEHQRVEPGSALAATAVGAAGGAGAAAILGGGAGVAGGGSAAAGAAGGAGAQADGVGSRTRRRKTLKGGQGRGFLSLLIALLGLVVAYAYASLASPTHDPQHNLDQFRSVVLDDFGGFLADLTRMALFLVFAMALVIIFRAWVDRTAAAHQGIRSAFRMQLPGLAALGLSTALFGMPFGYPAQTIHEKKAGYELCEARIALASVCGVLVLVLPFWLLWTMVGAARFMAEIGLSVVLMTSFSIAIPTKHTEGRAIFNWRKPVSLGLVLVLVLVFYGWQLAYLPTLVLPLVGLAALVSLPSFMQVGPTSRWFLDRPPEEPGEEQPQSMPEDETSREADRAGTGDQRAGDEDLSAYLPGSAEPPVVGELPDEPLPAPDDLPGGEPLPDAPLPESAPAPEPGHAPVMPSESEPPVGATAPLSGAPVPPAPPEEMRAPITPEEPAEEAPTGRQATACQGCGKAIDTNWKICPYCSRRQ